MNHVPKPSRRGWCIKCFDAETESLICDKCRRKMWQFDQGLSVIVFSRYYVLCRKCGLSLELKQNDAIYHPCTYDLKG